jgi:hypothetical protein
MWQFAINHDVCHGTAGSWLASSPFARHAAMHLFTLPALGGTTHMYYAFQHIGHHASLGALSLMDVASSESTTTSSSSSSSSSDDDDGVKDLAQFQLTSTMFLMPDSDGDLLAVGTLSLGRVLVRWGQWLDTLEESVEGGGGNIGGRLSSTKDGFSGFSKREYFPTSADTDMLYFHATKLLKCAAAQGAHVGHHFGLLLPFLFSAMSIPPPLNIVMLLIPTNVALRWYVVGMEWLEKYFKPPPSPPSSEVEHKEEEKEEKINFEEHAPFIREALRIGPSLSVHSWLWILMAFCLLFVVGGSGESGSESSSGGSSSSSGGRSENGTNIVVAQLPGSASSVSWTLMSVAKGFMYLYLSELFLYGFAMHPFMGYFLGTHRSGGDGFGKKESTGRGGGGERRGERENRGEYSSIMQNRSGKGDKLHGGVGTNHVGGCQPTMSTYSVVSSLSSLWLTHHVEHHDFPGVPWSRLSQITNLAPEYYENLEQSPGFCATIWRWIHHSGTWGYACQ